MNASITLITATFNKHEYIQQTAQSVFAQTRQDWQWWIILDYPTKETKESVQSLMEQQPQRVSIMGDATPGTIMWNQRFKDPLSGLPAYRPAIIINHYYPKVNTKYLMWLSDDDLLEPDALEQLAGALDSNPSWDIAHGSCDTMVEQTDGTYSYVGTLGNHDQGLNTGINPDCNIDGGQFMQTKRSYDALNGWKINIVGLEEASHCDGMYMAQLAQQFTFHYIGRRGLIHRQTSKSTFLKPEWAHEK